MKRTIRLNESELRQVIAESVRMVLNEKHRPIGLDKGKRMFRKKGGKKTTYYPLQNTEKYTKANGLSSDTMYKVGKVKARPSQAGRYNQGTLLGDFKEREGYVENGDGYMIVKNPRGEEYQVPMEEFLRKYTLDNTAPVDDEGYYTYNAFDKREISSPIKHNVYKDMSKYWGPGQNQFGRQGDAHIVNPGNENSYFIGDKELYSTHIRK